MIGLLCPEKCDFGFMELHFCLKNVAIENQNHKKVDRNIVTYVILLDLLNIFLTLRRYGSQFLLWKSTDFYLHIIYMKS